MGTMMSVPRRSMVRSSSKASTGEQELGTRLARVEPGEEVRVRVRVRVRVTVRVRVRVRVRARVRVSTGGSVTRCWCAGRRQRRWKMRELAR